MSYSPVACAAVCIVLLCLVVISVSLRLYVRIRFRSRLASDDLFSGLATVIFTALAITYAIGTLQGGIGKSFTDVSKDTWTSSVKEVLVCQLLYFVCTYLIKVSFALTLFRIVNDQIYIYKIYLILIVGAIISTILWFWLLFFCAPVHNFWEQVSDPRLAATCKTISSLTIITLVHAAWILVADLVLGIIIPMLLLHNLQMQTKTKASVLALLGLGSIASVATIVRIAYLPSLSVTDGLQSNNRIILWSLVEVAISIISTAAATWKPLMVHLSLFHNSSDERRSATIAPYKSQTIRLYKYETTWRVEAEEQGLPNTSRERILSGIQMDVR